MPQDSHITLLKKTHWFRFLVVGFKISLLFTLCAYIVVHLNQQQHLDLQLRQLAFHFKLNGWWFLLLTLLGVPLNWWLEARKWQLLAGPLVSISIRQSLRGVLTGLSLGFFTPHSLGDYLGRVWQLDHANRMETLGAVLLGRGAQFFSTLLFGMWGLWHWHRVDTTGLALKVCMLAVSAAGVMLILFLFFRQPFVRICYVLWPFAARFLTILGNYSKEQVFQVVGLSMLRYMVFATQFGLLLYGLGTPLAPGILLAGVTWVLLAKSVLPAFNFLSDLGVREFSALFFFGLYEVAPAPVLCASLAIWVINILAPTVVGAAYIWQLKVLRY